MELNEYQKMGDFEKHYWWHKGKLSLVSELHSMYFPADKKLRILEIGCGTGEVLNLLSSFGDVTGMDISEEAVQASQDRGFDVIQGDVNTMDLSSHEDTYDLVLALDVLEHIRDDMETLRRVRKMLKPGGHFFVTVPAYKFLWSNHDEALHHARRYHSVEIRQKLKDTGYELKKSTHFVAALFFPIATVRLLSNFIRRKAYAESHYFKVPKFVNTFFSKLLEFEAKLIRKIYLPIGTTLAAVGKKDDKKS